MISFLKKAGQILLQAGSIALGIGPILKQYVPNAAGTINTVVNDLQQLGQIIITVEAIGQSLNLTGAQKLDAATPLVAQAILQFDMMAGHKIQDPAKYNQGAREIAQGLVDIYNSLHADAATSVNVTVNNP